MGSLWSKKSKDENDGKKDKQKKELKDKRRENQSSDESSDSLNEATGRQVEVELECAGTSDVRKGKDRDNTWKQHAKTKMLLVDPRSPAALDRTPIIAPAKLQKKKKQRGNYLKSGDGDEGDDALGAFGDHTPLKTVLYDPRSPDGKENRTPILIQPKPEPDNVTPRVRTNYEMKMTCAQQAMTTLGQMNESIDLFQVGSLNFTEDLTLKMQLLAKVLRDMEEEDTNRSTCSVTSESEPQDDQENALISDNRGQASQDVPMRDITNQTASEPGEASKEDIGDNPEDLNDLL